MYVVVNARNVVMDGEEIQDLVFPSPDLKATNSSVPILDRLGDGMVYAL